MPLPTDGLAALQRRYDASKRECTRQTELARHYRAPLVELVEASKGFMGCQNPTGADTEGEWSPCGACWGCRLEAAVQRAEKALSAAREGDDGSE